MSDFTIYKGETLLATITLSWVTPLTAAQTAAVKVARSTSSTALISKTLAKTDDETGFKLSLTALETAALVSGEYVIQVTITDTDASRTKIEIYTLTVSDIVS